jgi:hypothetical protein
MSRSNYIHKGCDNDVTFDGALNASTGNYLNAATCTFTLYESIAGSEENGAAVTAATAISMAYVAASSGDYSGVLQSTVSLTRDAYYWIVCTLTQGDIVLVKRWQVQAVDEGYVAG